MNDATTRPALEFIGRLRCESGSMSFTVEGRSGRFGLDFERLADLKRARRSAPELAALTAQTPLRGGLGRLEGWILLRGRPLARFRFAADRGRLVWKPTPWRFASGRW